MNIFLSKIFVFILLLLSFSSWGQELSPSQSYSGAIKFHYGYILNHHPEMAVLSKSHISAFEFDLIKSTTGTRHWQRFYHYPNLGVGCIYSSLGNSEFLGKLYGFYPFADFPILKSRFYSEVRFGLGVAYLTEIFDLEENFRNTAIGRHFNALIVLGLNAGYRVSEDVRFGVGVSFIHFSNGGTRMPNYGINLPAVNASIVQRFSSSRPVKSEMLDSDIRTHWVLRAQFSCGSKEIFPIDGPSYFIATGSIQGFYKIWRGGMLGVSFDLGYDASDKELLNRKQIYPKNEFSIFKPGLSLGYALLLGDLSLSLHAGTYLYEPEKSDGTFYDQLMLNYKIWKGLHANLILKTHFAKADFVGLGFGYQLEF